MSDRGRTNTLDINQLGLSKEQRKAGSISFNTTKQNELKELWQKSFDLQGQLQEARQEYYDKKMGGSQEEDSFQKELQGHLRNIRQQLNRSIGKVLREVNEIRNEVIRNDKLLQEQDRLINETKDRISLLKNKVKESKKDLVNKKVVNELYYKQPSFSNEYIFHIALTALSIIVFFFIINK